MTKIYNEGDVESADFLEEKDGYMLFELKGFGAEANCSNPEDVELFFPDFPTEEEKFYLVVDSKYIRNSIE